MLFCGFLQTVLSVVMYSAAYAPLRTPFFGCVKRHLISDWRLAETRLWPSTTVRTYTQTLLSL